MDKGFWAGVTRPNTPRIRSGEIMSRKSRSTSKRQSRETAIRSTQGAATVTGGGRAFDRDFSPDYTPVIKDLKRIGTLAGTFFVILIVLSFFLK
jgi:hypothetical protein